MTFTFIMSWNVDTQTRTRFVGGGKESHCGWGGQTQARTWHYSIWLGPPSIETLGEELHTSLQANSRLCWQGRRLEGVSFGSLGWGKPTISYFHITLITNSDCVFLGRCCNGLVSREAQGRGSKNNGVWRVGLRTNDQRGCQESRQRRDEVDPSSEVVM